MSIQLSSIPGKCNNQPEVRTTGHFILPGDDTVPHAEVLAGIQFVTN